MNNRNNDMLPAFPPTLWLDYLPAFPYVLRFLPLWEAYCTQHVRDPEWQNHQQILVAFAASQMPAFESTVQVRALNHAWTLMGDLLRRQATVPRILSAIRIAGDLELRQDAVYLLDSLIGMLKPLADVAVDEPFLAVSARMAATDPENSAYPWLMKFILETRERWASPILGPVVEPAVESAGEDVCKPASNTPKRDLKSRERSGKKQKYSSPAQQMEMAVQLHRDGKFREADVIYSRILSRNPNDANALHLSGVIAHQSGQSRKAVGLIERAVRLVPCVPMFHYNLGAAYNALGEYEKAVQSYEKALSLDPNYAEVYSNLGNTFKNQGKTDEAIACHRKAIELKPDFSDAYNNLGTVYNHLHMYDDALACFHSTLKIKPESVEAFHNIGDIHREQYQLSEAEAWYRKAIAIKSDHPLVQNNLGVTLQSQGRIAEAVSCYDVSLRAKPDYAGADSNRLLALNYDHIQSRDTVFKAHVEWDRRHGSGVTPIPSALAGCRNSDSKIHIGYLSPDFRQHSVSYFIEPILQCHDGGRFTITCYSDTSYPDAVTQRLKALGWQWRDCYGISDGQLLSQIQADGVQILVDLTGHTSNNRMPLLARKPAAVQVSYIGYPNTTGLKAMDYRITDAAADPPGVTDHWYTEKLIRLPGSFLCYLPPANLPEVSNLPALKNDGITFASFNNRAKITDQVIQAWSAILKLTPGSRLIVKSQALTDINVRQRLAQRFADCGIGAQQLELCGFLPFDQHFELYQRVDLALDTFPYNGTTTTCEALWMGVPVLALEGDHHVSRVGVSLLSGIGLNAFIARSVEDYINKAVCLSEDVNMLSHTRSMLRKMMRDSPLMDAHSLTRSLESAYEAMWRRLNASTEN
jgi:predicted O-linked N-acetylglucosamine transferase (SPINDLY family)